MNKVYRHVPMAADEYLGHVSEDGKVYQARLGPDKCIGRVELDTGKIFESRLGPDKHVGRVELDSGKVYLGKLGPDEYIGRVDSDGRIYLHNRLAADTYIGKVVDMLSLAHGGAAMLLLVAPAYNQKVASETQDETDLGEEPGTASAPA